MSGHPLPSSLPLWSVVIPYFNERDYLPSCLASLIAQDYRPLQLILVDNASTDGSEDVCRALLADSPGITAVYLHEPRPGKINALECGLARVDTDFVAFCDADTFYPPHYIRRCAEVFAASPPKVGAVMAVDLDGPPQPGPRRRRLIRKMVKSRIFSNQCLTGGFGQTFRTAILRAAGGFSTKHWSYVFEDHEVMHRVLKIARSRYDYDLWCLPSKRRANRTSVDWTHFEKRLYGITPFALKDWYFYSFLSRRLAARKQDLLALREKTWMTTG